MITKDNYIEIGQVECSECKTALDWNAVDDAIRKYGLIALHRESDGSGYFGYTCPHCIRVGLHKTNEGFLKFLITGDLTNPEGLRPHPKGAHYLGYNPLPIYDWGNIDLAYALGTTMYKNHAINSCFANSAYFGYIKKVKNYPLDYQNSLSECYCSLIFDSIGIGPIPKVQYFFNNPNYDIFFKEAFETWPNRNATLPADQYSLKAIVDIENNTGAKIFSRYDVIDPIYSLTNEFIMRFGEMSDFFIFSRKYNKIQQKPVFGNDFFLLRREIYTAMIKNNPQLRVMKNTNFLNIICIPNIEYYIAYQQTKEFHETLFPTHGMAIDFSELKQIYKEIWNKFHNKNFQDLIKIMADNFIDDYLKIVRKIHGSFEKIWDLRQKYLYNIYDSIKSSQVMKQKTQSATNKHIETFKKLEEPYPALQKIITQNYEMIKIKEILLKFASSNIIDSFLLLGETGTGKELFAKAIYCRWS